MEKPIDNGDAKDQTTVPAITQVEAPAEGEQSRSSSLVNDLRKDCAEHPEWGVIGGLGVDQSAEVKDIFKDSRGISSFGSIRVFSALSKEYGYEAAISAVRNAKTLMGGGNPDWLFNLNLWISENDLVLTRYFLVNFDNGLGEALSKINDICEILEADSHPVFVPPIAGVRTSIASKARNDALERLTQKGLWREA